MLFSWWTIGAFVVGVITGAIIKDDENYKK